MDGQRPTVLQVLLLDPCGRSSLKDFLSFEQLNEVYLKEKEIKMIECLTRNHSHTSFTYLVNLAHKLITYYWTLKASNLQALESSNCATSFGMSRPLSEWVDLVCSFKTQSSASV